MSSEVDELKELLLVLKRISERIESLKAVETGMIYLVWCIWLSTLYLVSYLVDYFNLSYTIYFAYMIPSFIVTVIYASVKLPKTLRFLYMLISIGRGLGFDEKIAKKSSTLVLLVFLLSMMFMPITCSLYGNLGCSTNLLVALGLGNLTIYIALRIYAKITSWGGIALSSLLLVFAGLNVLMSLYKPGYEWFFTMIAMLFTYLLLAFYNFMQAFK